MFRLGPIDLDLKNGGYLTILGPSGAGKTVLLEVCLGLAASGSGRLWLDGTYATLLPPEQRRIAYLPQDLALFPHLSVRDNILFGARQQQLAANVIQERLGELTTLLDLDSILARRTVATLSGGEKQRVALARALLSGPRLLFLDEPFSALDAAIKRQLQIKLRLINRELGVTILHVTHDQEEAFLLGDRVAVGIRSEEVVIIRPDRPLGADLQDNLFAARVVDILGFGGTHTLTVAIADSGVHLDVELPNCAFRDLGYAVGDPLRVALRRRSLWTLPINSAIPKEAAYAQL